MNKIAHDLALQAAVKPRFRGQRNMLPRAKAHYPFNLEREYLRIVNAYMALLKKTVNERMKPIYEMLEAERSAANSNEGCRLDDSSPVTGNFFNIGGRIMRAFWDMQIAFEREVLAFNLGRRIRGIASQTRTMSIAQWRRLVNASIGINLLEDYYMGEFFRRSLAGWADTNVRLIKSVPQAALVGMRNIVQESWQQGLTRRELAKRLERAYEINRNRAQFWATDQLANLNADIAKQQQEDAGVQEYVWSTSRDERVRDNHVVLDGKRFSWASPPEVAPGRHCHPGKDYRCRCVALPVFNLPGLSLPWEKVEQ